MTISIRKQWFAATLVAAIAAPAAQSHPLAESGFSAPRAVAATVAVENELQAQSPITTIDRGARERTAERSAADAVPAALAKTIDRGTRERAAEQSAADAASKASASVASVNSEGFHLRDAGIGAAVTAGALMLGGALALVLIARSRRRAVHA